MKTDLSQATFIIPVRVESEDRMRNVITSISFLLSNFNTNVIIKEVDQRSFVEMSGRTLIISLSNQMNHCSIDKRF
jgi:hypothetical protein